jgi:hypothetical protein
MHQENILPADEKRARALVDELKKWVGATITQNSVIFVRQGAPISTSPSIYDPADLQRAFDLGLLHKRTLKIHGSSGTTEIEILSANETDGETNK